MHMSTKPKVMSVVMESRTRDNGEVSTEMYTSITTHGHQFVFQRRFEGTGPIWTWSTNRGSSGYVQYFDLNGNQTLLCQILEHLLSAADFWYSDIRKLQEMVGNYETDTFGKMSISHQVDWQKIASALVQVSSTDKNSGELVNS